MCYFSHEWGSAMFLVSLDILTAFDCIHHDVLVDVLVARGGEL